MGLLWCSSAWRRGRAGTSTGMWSPRWKPAAQVSPATAGRGRGPLPGCGCGRRACGTGGSGGLDRARFHEQLRRHVGVGVSRGEQPQHVQLPLGQRLDEPVRCGRGASLGNAASRVARKVGDTPAAGLRSVRSTVMRSPSSRKGRMTFSGSASASAAARDPSARRESPWASATSARRIDTLSRSQPKPCWSASCPAASRCRCACCSRAPSPVTRPLNDQDSRRDDGRRLDGGQHRTAARPPASPDPPGPQATATTTFALA
jgi:hypothetical protein